MPDASRPQESRRSRLGRWAWAAAIACALHIGGVALALTLWEEQDADDGGGAMSVQLAPLPAVARVDSEDLVAPGPDQVQAKLTQEASKQALEEIKDVPPVERSRAPDPEVALPKPQPVEEEQPEKAREEVPEKDVQQQDDEVPVTTAPPRVDAQPQPSSARSQELSPSLARAKANWENALSRQL